MVDLVDFEPYLTQSCDDSGDPTTQNRCLDAEDSEYVLFSRAESASFPFIFRWLQRSFRGICDWL